MNKVYGGTVRHHGGASLCQSCRWATVMETRNTQLVYCGVIDRSSPLPQPVVSCSNHDDKSTPTRQDYEKSAWILNTSRSGEVIGFVNPRQWKVIRKKQEKEEGEDEL